MYIYNAICSMKLCELRCHVRHLTYISCDSKTISAASLLFTVCPLKTQQKQ